MKSYLGLLCQGKSDFDHIEPFRQDDAFAISLDIQVVPSSPTLRQRLVMAGTSAWKNIVLEESATLLKRVKAPLTGVDVYVSGEGIQTMVPLDIDVSPFDNSGTKKEGVSRTYKGHDGFAQIFSCLGREGYGVHVELREGSVHGQKNTDEYLKASITLRNLHLPVRQRPKLWPSSEQRRSCGFGSYHESGTPVARWTKNEISHLVIQGLANT